MGVMDTIKSGLSALTGSTGPSEVDELRRQMSENPVDDTMEEWKRREEWLRPKYRAWKTSLAFERGDHWGQYDEQHRAFIGLAPRTGVASKPYINHYASVIRTIVANMTKTRPVGEVLPETSSSDDVEAAHACNTLLGHLWSQLDIMNVLSEIIRWILHTNTCYVLPRWDPNAGELVPLDMPPEMAGIAPQQFSRAGRVVLDVVSPFQVFPNKEARSWDQVQDLIVEHLMTPKQVQQVWPDITRKPEPDTSVDDGTSFLQVVESEQGYQKGKLEYVRVIERFILPCPEYPAGRHLCVTKDYTLSDEPYGEDCFPIIPVVGERYTASLMGRSWMWDALPPQRTLNSTWSQATSHSDLACNPPWLVPRGSVDHKDLTKRPGAIVEFDPGKGPPSFSSFASIPNWVLELPDRSQKLMSDLTVSDVLQGRMPYSGMSGRTIAFISDLDSTRLGTIAKALAEFMGKLGERCLDLIQQYGNDTIVFKALNDSIAEKVAFEKTDLRYGAVRFTESSFLPTPSVVRREQLAEMLQVGAITAEEYKEAIRGAGGIEDTDLQREDRAWARDNITVILQGGQPFTGNYMDVPIHLYETRKWMKSARFRRQPPEIIQRFEEYEQKLESLLPPPAPPSPPNKPPAVEDAGDAAEQQDSPNTSNLPTLPGVNAQEEVNLGMGM